MVRRSRRQLRCLKLAGQAIDMLGDGSAPTEEREKCKRRLLKGPPEFRELRADLPKPEVKRQFLMEYFAGRTTILCCEDNRSVTRRPPSRRPRVSPRPMSAGVTGLFAHIAKMALVTHLGRRRSAVRLTEAMSGLERQAPVVLRRFACRGRHAITLWTSCARRASDGPDSPASIRRIISATAACVGAGTPQARPRSATYPLK